MRLGEKCYFHNPTHITRLRYLSDDETDLIKKIYAEYGDTAFTCRGVVAKITTPVRVPGALARAHRRGYITMTGREAGERQWKIRSEILARMGV